MKVEVQQIELAEVEADLLVVGLFEGGELPGGARRAPGAADAKGGFRKLPISPGGGRPRARRRARQAR